MQNYDDNRIYWIWLQNICGAGSVMPELLTDAFDGSVVRLYEAEDSEYDALSFVKKPLSDKLKNKSLTKAREIIAYCENEGVGIITPDSAMYPKRLGRIQGRPIVLYYKGVVPNLDLEVCIAEVGTRNMTEYGAQTAYAMAYDLARAGAIVVSGMAKGVDGMAHRGAIDAGGTTIAVTGCGIDRVYPAEHKSLMLDIIKKGAVITEFPPFTPPMGRNFPVRNRIVSGLSLGTLVIEAPSKSGALITAEVAMKQGRDVFAIPGKLGEMSSTGSNSLIKNGAKMVMTVPDILSEYQMLYPDKIDLTKLKANLPRINLNSIQMVAPASYGEVKEDKKTSEGRRAKGLRQSLKENEDDNTENNASQTKEKCDFALPDDISELRRTVLTRLMGGPVAAEELMSGTSFKVDELLVELTMLELEGVIEALPGGSYKLIK